MNTDALVFKSHAVDHDVAKGMRDLAEHFQATRGAVFRLCVESGLAQLALGAELPPPTSSS